MQTARRAGAGATGEHLNGRFELMSVAVCSASGLVYLAWDHQLAQPVAVKEFLPEALAQRDPQGVVHPNSIEAALQFQRGLRAFVEEAQTLVQCQHPSLVRVLDVFETCGTAYRVMPWYRGRLLRDVRRKMDGPFGEPALRALLEALLGAIEAYQQVGGVHGGVNPSQVLLIDEDHPMLLGPGAARLPARAHPLHAPDLPADTSFLAPEQTPSRDPARRNAPLGPWTDFYSLAVLARYCITGTADTLGPDARSAGAEPLAITVARLPRMPSSPGYSSALLQTLDAALSADIASRPQTVAQFRDGLRGRAAARPVPSAPPRAGIAAPEAAPRPAAQADGSWRADPQDRYQPAAARDLRRPRGGGQFWLGLAGGLALVAVAAFGFVFWALQGSSIDVAAGTAGPGPMLSQITPAPAPQPPTLNTASVAPTPLSAESPKATAPAPIEPGAPLARPVAEASARNTSPRQECGTRTEFALYRCMQLQCTQARWQRHPQCERLAVTDSVD